MKTKIPPDPCAKVAARVVYDAKHGETTAQAQIEFIRRTCGCDHCREWRTQLGVKSVVVG
jgi:hypothetical protein